MEKTILILGGTAESLELARMASEALAGRCAPVASVAGVTGTAPDLPCEVHVGAFENAQALEAFIAERDVACVVDATHPFAERISSNAYDACLASGAPRLALVRPPWRLEPRDKWVEVPTFEAAAEALPGVSARAFLAIGSKNLPAFAEVEGVHMLIRLLAEPDEPPPLKDFATVIGRPPFSVESELALMREHRIDLLVSKQSGGAAGEAKVKAARELGLRMLFIARPLPEPGETVETVREALVWLNERI